MWPNLTMVALTVHVWNSPFPPVWILAVERVNSGAILVQSLSPREAASQRLIPAMVNITSHTTF